ncbi:MAG: flavodoxin [Kiritimatiellia bacterium]
MTRKAFIKNMGLAAGVAALGLGCSKEVSANETSTTNNAATPLPSTEKHGEKKMKCAVVYFSWSGNTRFAAETISKKAGADLFEIKAETPYNSNYGKCCDEAKPECYGKQLRPIQKIEGLNLAQYDVIFVGTPNWWGTMAPPVRTFLSQNAAVLKGKTVCLFQTNGGGGMQRVGKEFAELVPNSKVLPAQAFSGSSVRSCVKELEKFVTDRLTVK